MALRLRYTEAAPEAYERLVALGHYITTGTALEGVLLGLVYLRVSQMNACGFCMGLHAAELRKHHEPESRIEAVAEWRTSDAFTPKERAALAWAESVTDLSTHVPDEEFAAVSEYFEGKDLADLTFAVANINAWNRLGIAFAAEWKPARVETSGGAEKRVGA
jgi:AhpD family alkylhydroperoxidase